jgi:hypothetical protein
VRRRYPDRREVPLDACALTKSALDKEAERVRTSPPRSCVLSLERTRRFLPPIPMRLLRRGGCETATPPVLPMLPIPRL